jgi:CRP-like cAMP-binding protein
MSPSDIDELAQEMGEQRYAGGMYVFREGDLAARVHVVRSGTVELSRQLGGRHVTLQILRPGDVFGDVPALLGRAEPFDAKAIEDSVVLSIDTASLFGMLQTRSQVAQRWFVSLAERMAGLQDRLMDLLSGGLEAQIAAVLLREAQTGSDVRLTQGQISELLGVPRTSVQRVLKSLAAAGLIQRHYRRIELLDRGGLLAVADHVG